MAIRMLAALSMVLSLLGASAVGVSAAPNPAAPGAEAQWDRESIPPLFGAAPSDDICATNGCELIADNAWADGMHEVYFPAVGNADGSTGLGAAQTSITVQNLSVHDGYLFVYVGTPEDDDGVDLANWDVVEVAYLSGGASKTFQGSDLEIPAGDVRPVVVAGYNQVVDQGDFGVTLVPVRLAGVAKQAVTGASLPFTTSADSTVSGYNAIGGRELGFFDELYFPIVQTNCGPGGCWNSILRIANMGMDDNAGVIVRFFPADDGSGSLQTGFQLQGLVDVGETWSIDLSEWVPQGWVGSAHVYTDDAVGAIVDRVKPGTNMWITNSASNATSEAIWQVPGGGSYPYVLFAPDVRTDYNGWNTGINVANTVVGDTDVAIQYFGSNGNAPQAQTRRLAAHGMTYFYNPSDPSEDRCQQPATDVPGCEFIGGAIILSTNPVAVAVDGVKYFGNDANVGQAFSYAATGNAYISLQAALVQKGNPANGMGATSGINVMNPNAAAATVEATWLNPSGFDAANFGISTVWIPAYASGFVYTMFHHNLPNGYVGSAIVNSDLPVVATTANVDYQVSGDGTAIYNLSNPCGFFRQIGDCEYVSPAEPGAANATITQQVFVENPFIVEGEDDNDSQAPEAAQRTPLAGVLVTYTFSDGVTSYSGAGRTRADGTVTFAVASGGYSLVLADLPTAPAGYVYSGALVSPPVYVAEHSAETVTTVLTLAIAEGSGTLTKQLTNTGAYTTLESEVYFCPAVDASVGDVFATCAATAVVSAGFGEHGNAEGEVSAEVPAGAYTICMSAFAWYDADADGEQENYEEIEYTTCESTTTDVHGNTVPILVLDAQETTIVNDFDAGNAYGILDIHVRDDDTDLPLTTATVCVFSDEREEPFCSGTFGTGELHILGVQGGTYRITVSAPGYEQESTLIVYSPVADAIDGSLSDIGAASDVVISLDPAAAILNLFVMMDGVGVLGAEVTVHSIPTEGIRTESVGCAGDVVAHGTTNQAGEFTVGIAPGTYCVATTLGGTNEGTQVTTVTIDPNDPSTDVDALQTFTLYTGCRSADDVTTESIKEVC